jgi:hypothetical protein
MLLKHSQQSRTSSSVDIALVSLQENCREMIHFRRIPERYRRAPKYWRKTLRAFSEIHFLVRAWNFPQQKQNRCASHWPWQGSSWPNTTTNQQSRGTSLSNTMIANSLYIFFTVDCLLVASFLSLVKNTPPWPCWPWQLRFWDRSKRNQTDTAQKNQVERKLNSDVTRFFLSILIATEIYLNAMVNNINDQPEVSLLFAVGRSTYLT